MARLWTKRLLVGSSGCVLALAVGCKSAQPTGPLAHTPLLPGAEGTPIVVNGPVPSGPAPAIVTTEPTMGTPIIARGPVLTPPILPPGAGGPQHAPYALVRPMQPPPGAAPVLPAPREVASNPAPEKAPTLPAIVVPPESPKIVNGSSDLLPTPKPINVPGPSMEPAEPLTLKGIDKDPFLAASRTITPGGTPTIIRPPVEEKRIAEQTNVPLKPGQKFGHADDYRWVAGVLDYHQRGGYWTVRYADFSEDDRWGGKVRLVDDDRLREFKVGDAVFVSGELLAPVTTASSENRTTFPPFRIADIKVVEKAK